MSLSADELIEHLKGIRKIVINKSYGGFGLSLEATILYLEKSMIPFTLVDREDRDSQNKFGSYIFVNDHHFIVEAIPRDDQNLVAVVTELGEHANGVHAKLKIVKIPADVDWQIEEYDGLEWVAEAHRTWN
jgi:hypothetical protein